jgi:heme exporter protein D
MPDANTVLLPICVGLALLGVIGTGLAWRKGNKGRVVQGIAFAITPVGLYFTGLLRVVWDMVTDIVGWAVRLAFSPFVWLGFGLLALSVVLFVVGGFAAKRLGPGKSAQRRTEGTKKAAVDSGPQSTSNQSNQRAGTRSDEPPIDDEMKEIEELLKSRGIQ